MSTVAQLFLAIEQKLDKTDSQGYPDILDDEKRFWLDQAADRFVKQRYDGNNIKRKAFEQSQKRIDDLRATLVTRVIPATNTATNYRDAFVAELPNNYRYLIKVEVEIVNPDCNDNLQTEWFTPKQIEHDDFYAIQKDPFNKPKVNSPKFFLEGNQMILFAASATITNVRVTYIKLLRKLQLGLQNADGSINVYANPNDNYLELAVDTHDEVVDLAVKMLLENIESQRYQTNSVENTQTE
jgi:hypothetical protein